MKTITLQKSIKTFILSLIFLISLSFVQASDAKQTSPDGKKQYRYSDTFSSYDVQVKGDIELKNDDSGIKSISPGGYLKISKKTFGNKRSVVIESDSRGELSYEYYEGNKKIQYQPEGRKWFADVLLDVVRLTGIDAENRTKRIYAKKGVDGVLEEIGELSSNSVQALYFKSLLGNFKLTVDENVAVSSAISRMSSNTERGNLYRKYSKVFLTNNTTTVAFFSALSRLSSNTERGAVLTSIDEKIDFDDPKVTDAYFTCVDRMSSNSERGRVLRNVARTQEMTTRSYVRLLQSVKKLSSNTEMGSVMRSLDEMDVNVPDIGVAYFNAIDVMSSNTEAGSTMRDLLKKQQLTNDNFIRLCGSVKKLSSNTEMGSVLRSIPNMKLFDHLSTDAYFLAVNSMSSNTEAGSVMRDAIKRMELNDYSWVSLFNAAAKLSSNTEMGLVLSTAIDIMPFETKELDAFFAALGHMTSSTEQGRVSRLLVKNEKLNKYACLGILHNTRKISSNTEKSSVLMKVAETDFIRDEEVKSTFVAVAKTLSSDSEYRRVIDKLIE